MVGIPAESAKQEVRKENAQQSQSAQKNCSEMQAKLFQFLSGLPMLLTTLSTAQIFCEDITVIVCICSIHLFLFLVNAKAENHNLLTSQAIVHIQIFLLKS